MAIKGKLTSYKSLYIEKLSLQDQGYLENILHFFLDEAAHVDNFPEECYDLANDILALVKLE